MSSETTVGGIVGTLRLDADQFDAAMLKALGLVETLESKKVDVKVDADTSVAEAQLAALRETLDRVDRSNQRVGASGQQASRGMGVLATSIIALGPALVPVAAGAAGLGVAFAGLGVAGIAAIKGISNEMEDGTPLGTAYSDGLDTVKESLSGIARVAATNVLAPFQSEVQRLESQMPALTDQVGEFATVAGNTGAAVVNGLVSAFITLEPLMRDSAVYVQTLAQRFETLATGSGVTTFGDYVRSVFPQVVQTVEDLVETVARVVVAFAPLGGGVLAAIDSLSTAINAIPLPVLTALATAVPAIFLGFRAYTVVQAASTSLQAFATSSNLAAGAARGLTAAAGPVGVALAALTLAFTYQANKTRETQAAVNDYADALRASNGVIDESVRKTVAKKLADAGAFDSARTLGIGLSDLTDYALGQSDAVERVNAQMKASSDYFRAHVDDVNADQGALGDQRNAVKSLTDVLQGQSSTFSAAIQQNRDMAAATAETSGALGGVTSALGGQAAALGTNVTALQAAQEAQRAHRDQAAAATLQMQQENDAAGVLRIALDALSGKALSAAQAQQSFDQQTVSLSQSMRDAKGNIDRTKTAVDGNSAAAVANRGSLLGLVQSANAVAEATANQTGSTEAGRQKLIEMRDQILANATANGLSRDKVAAYIDQVLKIPTSVPPTKITVDSDAATARLQTVKGLLDSLHDRTINVVTQTQTKNLVGQGLSAAAAAMQANANGSLTMPSGVRAMADGGTTRSAMLMTSQAPILWNEAPGGEAYIPLAPSKRARSTQILAQTNAAMGNPLGAAAPTGPMQIEGTLDLGNGLIGMLRGVVSSEFEQQARSISAKSR